MTLKTSLQQWAALSAAGKRPRTQKYQQEIVQLILRKWPGDCDVAIQSITEQDVTEFVLKVGHYSASRFNAIVSMLRATVPAARGVKRRRVTLKDRPLLSSIEYDRLLKALDGLHRTHAGLIVRLLAHTGLRINEARQLRWSDVRESFIVAPGAITKSGRPRLIPFVNGVRQVLDGLRSVTGRRKRVLPQAECKRSLRTACKRARLPRLSHHDFRHLFATRCIQSGVDLPTVARWLGHSDGGALLAKTYFHLADEHSRSMAAKVQI